MNKKPDIHPDDIMSGNVTYKESHSIDTYFREFANDNTIVCIYSGPNRGPNRWSIHNVPIEVLRNYILKIIRPGMKIFFDDSYEGLFFHTLIDKIHSIIRDTDIDPSQIYYFSAAVNSVDLYRNFCQIKNIAKPINVYSYNVWEHLSYRVFGDIRDRFNVIKKKEKLFLCFNRRFRLHRYAIIGLLLEKDLVKNSYYSFFLDNYKKTSVIDELGHHNVSEKVSEIIYTEFQKNEHLFPMRLNIDSDNNKVHLDSDDMIFFDNSYFSLVTETGFFDDVIFFSEKIYKPITVRHPFILVSIPHSLKYLRGMGYKTFSPFIDETYDDIEDDEARMIAIVNEVERLSKFTGDEWIKWQHDVEHIVDHNHMIIRTRKPDEYAISRQTHRTVS